MTPATSKVFRIIWDWILHIQAIILILSSILVVLGISLTVIFRYIFEMNLFGMEEIIVIFSFWLYFIGGAYGSYEKSHITADFIAVYIKNERVRLFLNVTTSFITMLLCLLFTYWAVEFFIWSFNSGAVSAILKIPRIIPQSAIFIGFILMSFYFVVYFIQDLRSYLQEIRMKNNNKV